MEIIPKEKEEITDKRKNLFEALADLMWRGDAGANTEAQEDGIFAQLHELPEPSGPDDVE